MQLQKVQIKNYRSIEDAELIFDSTLKILVGKNESGKSNIIKSLQLLKSDVKSKKEDVRESLPHENVVTSSYINFFYTFNGIELNNIYQNVRKYFDDDLDVDNDFIEHLNNKISLKTFCEIMTNNVYQYIYISSSLRYYNKYQVNNKVLKLLQPLAKPKNIKIDEKSLPSLNPIFAYYGFDFDEMYDHLTIEDIDNIIKIEAIKIIKANPIDVHYWSYEEANLIPSSINIEEFANNPDICKPLKNIFYLAGHKNISTDLKEAKKASPNKYRNFLNRIAQHATDHFRNTWKEYKDISFSLEPNGDFIETGIREHNTYSFQQRSDGFKRFIGFLLMISISVRNETLKNSLILVDEPDVSLHPSGIRYLREELKKISEKNIVVAATHSIFMINSDSLEDYLIIYKENEKTKIEKPTESNISSEEVLYRALTFSIYELLMDNNILFEGWRDKKLFKVATSKFPANFKHLKEKVKSIGLSHTSGVKNVKNITPIFELVNKRCFILSDNDKAAKEKQNEFRKEKFFGEWYRYDEIDPQSTAITGEDYLTESYLKNAINKLVISNPELQGTPSYSDRKGIVSSIETWLKSQTTNLPKTHGDYIEEYKSLLFNDLKPSDIQPSYYSLIEKLIEKILT